MSPCCHAALLIWLPGGSEEMFLPRKKSQPLSFQSKALISKQKNENVCALSFGGFPKDIPKILGISLFAALNKKVIYFTFRQHWTDNVQANVQPKSLFKAFSRCPSDPAQLLSVRQLQGTTFCSGTKER